MTNAEANAVPASGSDVRNGDVGLFCVIRPTATQTFGRTWKTEMADAVKHATKMIRNKMDSSNKIERLFVVQVVQVVELPQAKVDVRGVSAEDVDDLTGE